MILGLGDSDLPSAQSWSESSRSGRIIKTTPIEFTSIPSQLLFLREMVKKWRGMTWTRELAINLIRERCPPKNRICHAVAIAEWVQSNVYYVNELPEVFQEPPRTVELAAGDCDDFTTLIGSLCESIGIPVEIVGVKIDGFWRHVFPRAAVRAITGTKILPLDATLSAPVLELADPIRRALQAGHTVETMTV